jgi:hypothetical protein
MTPISAAKPETTPVPVPTPVAALDVRIGNTGDELLTSIGAALEGLSERPSGPQALATRLGIDKVLASRLLKAVRAGDPISAVHRMPGPEPLRRVLAGLESQGVPAGVVATARRAVDRFESLIRHDIGDRAALDAIVSAWVPEARREFELRRKQAAFRAMSQLKGAEARAIMATVMLHPSPDGEHLDILWINGLIGLQRLRPGASVKVTTRRMSRDRGERMPRTLDGAPVNDLESLMLKDYCTSQTGGSWPALRVHHSGEVVQYSLGGEAFGPGSAIDFVFAEASLAEIKRYRAPSSNRKSYVFAETSVPAAVMQFDAFVHESVFPPPGSAPSLRIYDTSFDGVAGANDPARDIDVLDLCEYVEPMGTGLSRCRSADVPRYSELVRSACEKMGWEASAFRGYRVRIDYPVYGSQATLLFDAPERG